MNRIEIKEEAKKIIKGNKWNIWWPTLLIGFISGLLSGIIGPQSSVDTTTFKITYATATPLQGILILLLALATGILMAGYTKYLINFVRTGKFNSSDILNTAKEKWLNIIIAEVLTSIIIALCSLLFVIPGIIMTFAYAFVTYLVVDTDVAGSDALKKSREMMKGYKMDYFVFNLSFIGWVILVPFTLGILAIWLVPYMTVAEVIYYDKLKSITKTK